MTHHTKKPRLRRRPKRGIYVSEARGLSSDGRWCPLCQASHPDTDYWQFRAVLYAPAKGRP
jgi:hypothetical protein